MNIRIRALSIFTILGVAGCGPTLPLAESLRFESSVEYVEVGSLIAASENVRVPLGPGRSYWFNGSDGSRWASDRATLPPSPGVVIIHEGRGLVYTPSGVQEVRHVAGPRDVKRGWYGRVVETRAASGGPAQVTLENGRRFEVRADDDDLPTRMPYEVVLGEDETRIFALRSGAELVVVRELPRE